MRAISGDMAAMIAKRGAEPQTRARCLWMALRDGTVIGVTDHDRDLRVDMPDISDMPVLFQSSLGVITSDISLAVGLDADNFEISGPLSPTITRAGVMGKRFNRARVRIFEVDWTKDSPDIMALMAGNIADAKVDSGGFTFEVRSDFDRYNQTIGRVLSPYCKADFGDSQCMFVLTNISATITAVLSDFQFTLNLAGTYADDFFNLGTISFLTGALAGIEEVEVFDYAGSTSALALLVPLPRMPLVGDTLYIRRGCSNLKSSTDATIPTCLSYGNVINFRGFDQVPGSDVYLKIPVPGSNGA